MYPKTCVNQHIALFGVYGMHRHVWLICGHVVVVFSTFRYLITTYTNNVDGGWWIQHINMCIASSCVAYIVVSVYVRG